MGKAALPKDPGALLRRPSAEELESLIEAVKDLHAREVARGRVGDIRRLGGVLISDPIDEPLVIIGDLHGDIESLEEILSKVWGLIQRGAVVVFLGDYIDRGTPEGQASVLAAVLRLKEAAPERVILLRGNHEPPPGLEPSPHDYPLALLRLYDKKAPALYEESRALFNTMPHALLVKGWALLVHGGIPTGSLGRSTPEEVLGAGEDPPMDILEEILWNDPVEDVEFRRPSIRGAGYEWGPKATAMALKKLNVKYIIRAHEAVYTGYKLNHGGRVVTVFSRRGMPYGNPKAAFLACPKPPEGGGILSCIRVIGS